MRRLLGVMLLTACANEAVPVEPRPDAAREPEGPAFVCSEFGAPVLFPFPVPTRFQVDSELTPDTLEAWFPGSYGINVSRRPDTESQFGAATGEGVGALRSPHHNRFSGDQRIIMWRDALFTEPPQLYQVRRASSDVDFSTGSIAVGLAGQVVSFDLDLDGSTIYFSDINGYVYSSTRPDLDSAFEIPTGQNAYATTLAISADEREMFFNLQPSNKLLRRTRESRYGSWGQEQQIAPIGIRPELSPDSTTLYFFVDDERWMMTRSCEQR